jgi:hypothetical protein
MQECAKNEVFVETKANVEKADDSAENNPALWKWSGSLDELTNRCAALGASAPAPQKQLFAFQIGLRQKF